MATFTQRVLQKHSEKYLAATTNTSFVRKAATGELQDIELANWLVQDVMYARAYVGFASRLVALYSPDPLRLTSQNYMDAIAVLGQGLVAIAPEIALMQSVLEDIVGTSVEEYRMTPATESYLAYMKKVSEEASPYVGMACLWVMEQCFIDVWRTIEDSMPADKGSVLQRKLGKNWTNPVFRSWVKRLTDVIDTTPEEHHPAMEKVILETFEYERLFWPEI